jgi:hypothetical protein
VGDRSRGRRGLQAPQLRLPSLERGVRRWQLLLQGWHRLCSRARRCLRGDLRLASGSSSPCFERLDEPPAQLLRLCDRGVPLRAQLRLPLLRLCGACLARPSLFQQ